MEHILIALLFGGAAVVSGLAAYTGHRGWVTDPDRGYRVPDRVRDNPVLSHRANQLVATWCLLASGLALAPAIAMFPAIASDFHIEMSSRLLAVTAVYGVAVAAIGRYPFERIRRL